MGLVTCNTNTSTNDSEGEKKNSTNEKSWTSQNNYKWLNRKL